MIHFHANGEDISQTVPILSRFCRDFKINVIAVEYPGYGIYHIKDQRIAQAQQIIIDAEAVYRFLVNQLGVDKKDIIVSGRSIGSGPACHLAAKFDPECLILISPIKSVNDVARLYCGRITDMLIEERFNNVAKAMQSTCPTIIMHGLEDKMVPHEDSIELMLKGFINAQTHLFLRDGMTHNKFDYEFDLIRPLNFFFNHHSIVVKSSKHERSPSGFGYIDLKDRKNKEKEGYGNRSRYHNNFQAKFLPVLRAPNGNDEQ